MSELRRHIMMQAGKSRTVTALRIYGNAYFAPNYHINDLVNYSYSIGFRRISGTGIIVGQLNGLWLAGGLSGEAWGLGYSRYFSNKIPVSDDIYEITGHFYKQLLRNGEIISTGDGQSGAFYGNWYINAINKQNARNSIDSINDIIYIDTIEGKITPYDNNGIATLRNEGDGTIFQPILGNGRTELIEIPINFDLLV